LLLLLLYLPCACARIPSQKLRPFMLHRPTPLLLLLPVGVAVPRGVAAVQPGGLAGLNPSLALGLP